MAIKARNVANQRKAQMWNERDDATLVALLRRKIKDVTVALRESESPYERSRLRSAKTHYKDMLHKVESGFYNGDIIFNELKASAALSQEQALSSRAYQSVKGGKIYNNSYNSIDFDYESAFRKKRYYGFSLPIIMTLLSAIIAACFIIGFFLPKKANQQITDALGINFGTFVMYRLGPTEDGNVIDITINNIQQDVGVWPEGYYTDEWWQPEDGVPYENEDTGEIPEKVNLYADCGCEALYLDTADIIKAWFHTKMLATTRIDFLEDLSYFQGDSFYYQIFLSGTKASDLVIAKNEDGNYDTGTIYNHIGVYGTIMFTIVAFIMTIVLFVINFVRIFTYTSRRIHGTTIFTFLMCAFAMISPALATCEGTMLGTAISNYLVGLNGVKKFVATDGTTAGVTLAFVVPAVLCVVLVILPFLFKNRYKKLPTRLPKGNKIGDPFNRKKKARQKI